MSWVGDTPVWEAPQPLPDWVASSGTPVLEGTGPGLTTVEAIAGVPDGALLAVRNEYALNAVNLYRRGSGDPIGSGWSHVGSVPIPPSATMRGAPRVEFTRFRRGATTAWYLSVAAVLGGEAVYLRSRTGAFLFEPDSWRMEDFDQTEVGVELRIADFAPWAPSLTWDPRTGPDVVRGVRGMLAPVAAIRSCEVCEQSEQCTIVGDTPVCALGGLPTGTFACPPDSECPAGFDCVDLGGSPESRVCVLDGYLAASERRLPAADGLVPGHHLSRDDWRMLRQGYCLSMRLQRALAPVGATIPGTAVAYSDPAPGAENSTCSVAIY